MRAHRIKSEGLVAIEEELTHRGEVTKLSKRLELCTHRNVSNHLKVERKGMGSPRPLAGNMALGTTPVAGFGSQNCKKVHFLMRCHQYL